jgi:uncharacterized repeat protein (TIGR01451 family)
VRARLAIALLLVAGAAHAQVKATLTPQTQSIAAGANGTVSLGATRLGLAVGPMMSFSLPTPAGLGLGVVTDPSTMASVDCSKGTGGTIGAYVVSCMNGMLKVTVNDDNLAGPKVNASYQGLVVGTSTLNLTVNCANDCGTGLTVTPAPTITVGDFPVALTAKAETPTAPIGGDGIFDVTYTNQGAIAEGGIVISAPIPADTAVDKVAFAGMELAPTGTWTAAGPGEAQIQGNAIQIRPLGGNLAAGQTFSAQVKLKLTTAKDKEAIAVTFTATASAPPVAAVPTKTASAQLLASASGAIFSLTKAADRTHAKRGDHVVYTVTLTPASGATPEGSTIGDALSTDFSLASLKVSTNGTSHAVTCPQVAFPVGALAVSCPGAGAGGAVKAQVMAGQTVSGPVSLTLDTTVRATASGPSLVNQATAVDGGGAPIAGTATSSITLDNAGPANAKAHLIFNAQRTVATRGDLVPFSATIGVTTAPLAGPTLVFNPGQSLRPFGQVNIVHENGGSASVSFREENGHILVPLGPLAAAEVVHVTLNTRVSVRATLGPQSVSASISDDMGINIDNGSASVRVEADPDFDLATIVGTVWRDDDGDGKRSAGEAPIEGALVVMEDGVSAVTDGDGRYHIAAVVPGQRVVKLAPHTLAPGAKVTTDGTRVVSVTAGIVTVIDFGVAVPPPEAPAARLTAAPEALPELTVADAGHLRYRLAGASSPGARVFVDGKAATIDARGGWRADVTLSRGRTRVAVITAHADGRVVVGARDVFWIERAEGGSAIIPRPEEPRLVLRFPPGALADPRFTLEGAVIGTSHIVKLSVAGADLHPDKAGRLRANLRLPDDAKAGVPIAIEFSDGLTAKYQHVLETGGDFLFLVGIAEGKLGYVVKNGAAGGDGGLYAEGRVALYAKGKIQGRYLIEGGLNIDSSQISDWRDLFRGDPTKVFRSLDPDRFYPVYGDASSTTENAPTRGALYVKIQVDQSQLVFGNVQTGLTGVEFGRYSRSVTGGRLDFVLAGKTPDGPPLTRVIVFGAWLTTARAHDELRGTGGSLYYLSHRTIVEGSMNLRVELRDAISDRPIDNRALRAGVDYEIDPIAGRLTLRDALSSLVASQSLVRSGALDGGRAYLIADYEYVADGQTDAWSAGGRATQQIGPVRLGGTFVTEGGQSSYYLVGGDARLDLGRFGNIVGEFAHSEGRQSDFNRSDDGGLTYNDLVSAAPAPGQIQQGNAWKAEGDLKFGSYVTFHPYVRSIDRGFTDTAHAQDTGLFQFGGEGTADFFGFHLRLHYDERHIDNGAAPGDISPFRRDAGGDIARKFGRWEVKLGARYEDVEDPDPTQAGHRATVAGRVGFDVVPRLNLYALGQWTVDNGGIGLAGRDVTMAGLGAIVKLPWNLTGTVEGTYGPQVGLGGLVGLKTDLTSGRVLYGTYTISQDHDDIVSSAFAVGGRERLGQTRATIYAEDQFRDGRDSLASLDTSRSHMQTVGADVPLWKKLTAGVGFERGDVAGAQGQLTRNSGTLHASYAGERIRVQLKAELRDDDHHDGNPSLTQWLASGATTLLLHKDFTLRAKALVSYTNDANHTHSLELSGGFSYRPSWIDGAALLGRYAYIDDQAPAVQTPGAGAVFSERAHAFSLGGEARLFWRFSLGEKIAAKLREDPAGNQWMLLNVTRLMVHVTKRIDAVGEYRLLMQPGLGTQQGVAVEANYLLGANFRLGVGYNFADFSDDELLLGRGSQHGVFVRAQGYY